MSWKPRTPPIEDGPIRLTVCVSGGGTTLTNLIERIAFGDLNAKIALVVANKPGIRAISVAENAGIPVAQITKSGKTTESFSLEIFEAARQTQTDLVILGGFLALIEVPPDYENKVINIHPSLIPAFCGKGFHGEIVHQAALNRGVKFSGCTVHYANNRYDEGPIILQKIVPVLDDDTSASLAARVFSAEREALPEAIALHAQGQILTASGSARTRLNGPR